MTFNVEPLLYRLISPVAFGLLSAFVAVTLLSAPCAANTGNEASQPKPLSSPALEEDAFEGTQDNTARMDDETARWFAVSVGTGALVGSLLWVGVVAASTHTLSRIRSDVVPLEFIGILTLAAEGLMMPVLGALAPALFFDHPTTRQVIGGAAGAILGGTFALTGVGTSVFFMLQAATLIDTESEKRAVQFVDSPLDASLLAGGIAGLIGVAAGAAFGSAIGWYHSEPLGVE